MQGLIRPLDHLVCLPTADAWKKVFLAVPYGRERRKLRLVSLEWAAFLDRDVFWANPPPVSEHRGFGLFREACRAGDLVAAQRATAAFGLKTVALRACRWCSMGGMGAPLDCSELAH